MAEDMTEVLERLQGLQDQMARAQDEVAAMQVTGESGGGVVKVTASGNQQILKIEIAKEIVDPNDIELLEDLVMGAVNRALERASEVASETMSAAARSLLPPGFPM